MSNSCRMLRLQGVTALTMTLFLAVNSPAGAFSKEELLEYRDTVSMIVEESSLRLEPGTLRRGLLAKEERKKKAGELFRFLGTADDASQLGYWAETFLRCSERLSREVLVKDQYLEEWNKSLSAGYRDSYEVTTFIQEKVQAIPSHKIRDVLENDEQAGMKIGGNAKHHHGIRRELEEKIDLELKGDHEAKQIALQLSSGDIENTWK